MSDLATLRERVTRMERHARLMREYRDYWAERTWNPVSARMYERSRVLADRAGVRLADARGELIRASLSV